MCLSRRAFAASLGSFVAIVACTPDGATAAAPIGPEPAPGLSLPSDPATVTPIARTDAEWQALLPPGSYRVLREAGTERAFSGRHWNNHETGAYVCSGCGLRLFTSEDKFDSGTGWPSYTRPLSPEAVEIESDSSYGMKREEALCRRCGGHLGHVFDDGPAPTGRRWCINSGSLTFQPSQR